MGKLFLNMGLALPPSTVNNFVLYCLVFFYQSWLYDTLDNLDIFTFDNFETVNNFEIGHLTIFTILTLLTMPSKIKILWALKKYWVYQWQNSDNTLGSRKILGNKKSMRLKVFKQSQNSVGILTMLTMSTMLTLLTLLTLLTFLTTLILLTLWILLAPTGALIVIVCYF